MYFLCLSGAQTRHLWTGSSESLSRGPKPPTRVTHRLHRVIEAHRVGVAVDDTMCDTVENSRVPVGTEVDLIRILARDKAPRTRALKGELHPILPVNPSD